MRYVGIDYGAKKIGLALSDSEGKVAFPHSVIPNDEHAVAAIVVIIVQEDAEGIVAGNTRTESGSANEITEAFSHFVEALERVANLTVFLVREGGTTGVARAGLGEGQVRGQVQSPRKVQDEGLDARAAALILQRYLDAKK